LLKAGNGYETVVYVNVKHEVLLMQRDRMMC